MATVKPIIVVVDDMPERIDWLKNIVGDRADVMWSETVSGLLSDVRKAESAGRLMMVILDHDLDLWSGKNDSMDANGETGTDAAKKLSLSDKSIPVLVWSMNERAAKGMEDILFRRGFLVTGMPFHYNRQNATTIRMHISSFYADHPTD